MEKERALIFQGGWPGHRPEEVARMLERWLTDEGMDVLRRHAPGHVDAVRQAVFDRLTPEQQKSLGEIMGIVAEGLQPSEAGADLPWLR